MPIILRCCSCRLKLDITALLTSGTVFFLAKQNVPITHSFSLSVCLLDSGPHTLSSTRRGCWPTSWESSLCVLGGLWAMWSPRRTTDVLQTQRKSLCLSTSRLWLKASPPARPDHRKKELSKQRFKMFSDVCSITVGTLDISPICCHDFQMVMSKIMSASAKRLAKSLEMQIYMCV